MYFVRDCQLSDRNQDTSSELSWSIKLMQELNRETPRHYWAERFKVTTLMEGIDWGVVINIIYLSTMQLHHHFQTICWSICSPKMMMKKCSLSHLPVVWDCTRLLLYSSLDCIPPSLSLIVHYLQLATISVFVNITITMSSHLAISDKLRKSEPNTRNNLGQSSSLQIFPLTRLAAARI